MEVSSEENPEEEAEGVRISKKRLLQGKSRERELIDASHRTKKEKQLLKCNLDMIRTAGRCYSLPGGDEKLGGRAGGAVGPTPSRRSTSPPQMCSRSDGCGGSPSSHVC